MGVSRRKYRALVGSEGKNQPKSEFLLEVYRAASQIPRGRVATYQDLARAVGVPGAARAVGAAMARNRDTAVVPCHRVVRSDGYVGGYAGGSAGTPRKAALLRSEGVEVDPATSRVRRLERVRFVGFKIRASR